MFAGCSTLWPDYAPPRLDLPPASTQALSIDRQWWRSFADPVLNQLIDDALLNNYDLAKASANLKEARANLGVAESLQSPRLDAVAKANSSLRQLSLGANNNEFNKTTHTLTLGAQVSWEVDLWGRIDQLNKAAQARLAASELTRNAVSLSVSSAVAQSYFQLRAYERKLEITRIAAANLKAVSALELRRWQAAVGTELAYRQSLAEHMSTEARLPELELAVGKTELALQVLAGRSPHQLATRLPAGSEITVPDVPHEFDSALLLRRPDVAAAEQLLIAAHADVHALAAERYPRLSLALLAGVLSTSSKIVSGTPLFVDASAALLGPVYDAGLVFSKVQGGEARRDAAIAYYRNAVTQAYREIYEAMLMRESGDKQLASSLKELASRKQSQALMQRSYDAGRSSKFEVLSESIKVLNSELSLVDARQNQWVARSQYYKALGGGF